MKDELFTPLRMTASTFDQNEALRDPAFARGHVVGKELPDLSIPMIPAGGMYSNVTDMAKFVSFNLAGGNAQGKRLIAEELLKDMYTPQFAATKDEKYGYGLGIGVSGWKGATLLGHEGAGYGYNSALYWVPEYEIGAVVLANAVTLGRSLPGEIANQALLLLQQAKYGAVPPDQPLVPSGGHVVRLPAEQLHRLEGTYSREGRMATFKIEDGTLVYLRGNSKVSLSAHGATTFTSSDQTFSFPLDSAGKVTGVRIQGWRHVGEFMSINDQPNDPAGPNRPEWQAHVGEYVGKLWGAVPVRANVAIRNGYLYVNRPLLDQDGWLKLTEYEPALFFSSDGDAVRFQGDRLSFANQPFVKSKND